MGTTVEDYEDFRPCFFESGAEDEFYDAPAPSEDIWKKFELLPTPPRSPKHEVCYNALTTPSTLDKLRLVSEILDDPICKTVVFPEGFSAKCMDTCCNFNSKLIHDCMWSGSNIPDELKIGHNVEPKLRSRSCSISSNSDVTSSSLCVDPNSTAVFPYPVSTSDKRPQPKNKPEMISLGAETPSESEPDSDDDEDDEDDDDDDDEDEEIDVVTVAGPAEKVQVNSRYSRERPVLPATPTASAQVAAMHNYTAAAPKSPKSESSNSSSSCNSSSNNSPSRTSHGQKRHRTHHHHDHSTPLKRAKISVAHSSELRSVMHRYRHQHCRTTNNNRCSSDSEDSDCKRAQHNVLERKRRNDLKSSFHRLRDNVPDLQSQERAAKVTILKKATDHIMYLRRQHQTLNVELDRQQRTHEALQRRLRLLRSK